MLCRKTADVLKDLPPLRIGTTYLPHSKKLDTALKTMGLDPDNLEKQMAGSKNAAQARRLTGTYKTPLVAEILAEELDRPGKHKVVVLAHHHDSIDLLIRRLLPFGVTGFRGTTPKRKRQEAIDRFQSQSRGSAYSSAQDEAAGIGINLQVANQINPRRTGLDPGK